MANSVDLVIGSEAIKQVESLISKLSIADAELLKISQSAMGASKGIAGISTPSGLDKTVSSTTTLNAQLEKQNAIITKLHADIAKKAEQSRLAEIRLQQQREKAFDNFEKNAQKEVALNTKNEGAYQRIQNSVNLLTKAYNDLAIKKQLGGTLTAKEEVQLTSLTTRISTYQKALLATDATIGKNQRNVGNYASGYNALGNSINQLSREAPAFANSVNTGFMALSNNFPALFDAINGIRDKNKMLVAEGKPTTSLFSQLASGIFSWQTALSVGVTLLTLYGGKIVTWIGSLMDGGKAISTLAEKQEQLNDALNESSGRYAEEKVNIDVLYKTATDLNASYVDRKRAVDDLQEQYPFYFKNLSDEAIMAGDAKAQYDLLSAAILTTARARAAEGILQDREKERLETEQDNLIKINNLYKELARTKNSKDFVSDEGGGVYTAKGKESIKKDILDIRKESVRLREQWAKEDAFFVKKVAEGNAIEDTLKPEPTPKKKAKQKESKREDLEHLESYIKPVGNIVEEINTQIESLKVIRITGTPEEREEAKKDIETLIELKKQLMGGSPTGGALPDFVVPTDQDIEKVKELTNETKNYLRSFVDEFASKSGFEGVLHLFDGKDSLFSRMQEGMAFTKESWKSDTIEMMEGVQEVYNFISERNNARFDAERERLDSQYEFALKGAGDNKAAQEKLALDLENKKKEIANRENKAKQKQAIFNIAIDTAQAIMSLWVNPGFPAAIPMAIAVGALGAVQIAMVAGQKIPQYFDGTDNHIGGMMLVNDGAGANFQEKVILPNGKEIMPEGRNVLMNAPKGTKVLTHEQQIMQMLNERGISMSAKYSQNNGMTANEMDAVMAKHFAKIQTNNTTFDRKGFRSWSESNGNKTIQNNNRVSRVGFSV